MTAKNRSASAKKALKSTVKELSSKLDRADAKAKRLKSEAARLKKARAKLEAEVKELKERNKRLEKVSRLAGSPKPALGADPPVVTDAARSDVTQPAANPSPAVKPSTTGLDASWTVAQLRAEARSRGLTGLSGKTKAQLLDALR